MDIQLFLSAHCSIDARGLDEVLRIVDFLDTRCFDGDGFKTCGGLPRLAGPGTWRVATIRANASET